MHINDYHRRLSLFILISLISSLPIIGLFSGKFAALAFILIALFPTLFYLYEDHKEQLYQSPLAKWCIAGLLWMLISLCYTTTPLANAALLWVKMLLIVVCSFSILPFLKTLQPSHIDKLFVYLTAALTGALLLANIEIILDSPLTRTILWLKGETLPSPLIKLNQGAIILALFSWPSLVFLAKRTRILWAVAFYILTLFTLCRLESQTACMAYLVGGAIYLLTYYFQKSFLFFVSMGIFLCICSVPIVAYYMDPATMFTLLPTIPGSAEEYRLFIWHAAAVKAFATPLLGHGFDSARSLPFTQAELFHDGRPPIPLHPHNNVLQIFLELGLIGLGLFVGFLYACIRRIRQYPSASTMALMTTLLCTSLLIGATGFGVWQNWLICSYLLAAMLAYISIEA